MTRTEFAPDPTQCLARPGEPCSDPIDHHGAMTKTEPAESVDPVKVLAEAMLTVRPYGASPNAWAPVAAEAVLAAMPDYTIVRRADLEARCGYCGGDLNDVGGHACPGQ